jgi:hypothetical protein
MPKVKISLVLQRFTSPKTLKVEFCYYMRCEAEQELVYRSEHRDDDLARKIYQAHLKLFLRNNGCNDQFVSKTESHFA